MRTAELQKYAGVFPDEFMSEVESLLKRRFRFAHWLELAKYDLSNLPWFEV